MTLLKRALCVGFGVLMCSTAASAQTAFTDQPGCLKSEFIFDNPPFKSSHASTLIETSEGILAAWFGGTAERQPDVAIWSSRLEGGKWTPPVEIVNGKVPEESRQYPTWNPVLFQPRNGPLYLFYKVGPSPSTWWGRVMSSTDNGRTWSASQRLPNDIIGPVRNKPVELADGTILAGASSENAGWRVHMEWTRDPFKSWKRTGTLNSVMEFGVIQPTILVHATNRIQILNRSKQGRVIESWSENGGKTWSPMKRTALPNPNSAIDAVRLQDGRSLLVYNHTTSDRSPINVALSNEGLYWFMGPTLETEPGAEFSYPAVIQSRDGLVHITYTWKRLRIKYAVIDPAKVKTGALIPSDW